MDNRTKAYSQFAVALILAGCGTAASVVEVGDNAWRLAAIDYTEAAAQQTATLQANEFCARRGGQVPYVAFTRIVGDMPGRYNATLEFQCTAGGASPAAQAEAQLRGYQRDCAIAGFLLGTPQNLQCAMEISAKANAKPGTAP